MKRGLRRIRPKKRSKERVKELEVNIENAQVNLLLEVNGKIHLVGMDKDKLDAVEFLIKNSVSAIVPTNKTQRDLLDFLDYKR